MPCLRTLTRRRGSLRSCVEGGEWTCAEVLCCKMRPGSKRGTSFARPYNPHAAQPLVRWPAEAWRRSSLAQVPPCRHGESKTSDKRSLPRVLLRGHSPDSYRQHPPAATAKEMYHRKRDRPFFPGRSMRHPPTYTPLPTRRKRCTRGSGQRPRPSCGLRTATPKHVPLPTRRKKHAKGFGRPIQAGAQVRLGTCASLGVKL